MNKLIELKKKMILCKNIICDGEDKLPQILITTTKEYYYELDKVSLDDLKTDLENLELMSKICREEKISYKGDNTAVLSQLKHNDDNSYIMFNLALRNLLDKKDRLSGNTL